MGKKRKKRMSPLSRKYAVSGSFKGCQALIKVKEVKGATSRGRTLKGSRKKKR